MNQIVSKNIYEKPATYILSSEKHLFLTERQMMMPSSVTSSIMASSMFASSLPCAENPYSNAASYYGQGCSRCQCHHHSKYVVHKLIAIDLPKALLWPGVDPRLLHAASKPSSLPNTIEEWWRWEPEHSHGARWN